jgi:hypothetical protein
MYHVSPLSFDLSLQSCQTCLINVYLHVYLIRKILRSNYVQRAWAVACTSTKVQATVRDQAQAT